MIEGEASYRSSEEAAAARAFETRERENSVEQEKQKPFDAVIVLGSGIENPFWKWYNERHPDEPIAEPEGGGKGWLGLDARMRTIAAAEMYRQGLTGQIIFTGGKTGEQRGIPQSEAELMKDYAAKILKRAGLKDEEIEQAIVLEDKATNTIENIANICNIIDKSPDDYRSLAVLTNQYHVDRAQEILSKFNLKAEGFSAEDLLKSRSPKYNRVIERFFSSPSYQDKLVGEMRWTKGLKELPAYWHPQAWAVDDPKRMEYLLSSFGLEGLAEKVGQKELTEFLKTVDRIPSVRFLQKIPAEKLAEEKEQEPKKRKIFIARHGESTHNVAEVPYFAGGSLEQDASLTEKGVESAKKVAEKLKQEGGIDILVSSDLQRSRETAEIIAKELGEPIEIVEMAGLREVHVGELTGKTREQVRTEGSEAAKRALELFISGDIRKIDFPGGDSYESACQRVKESLDRIIKEHGDKAKIAIVGHGNINKIILSLMFPEHVDLVNQLDLSHERVVGLDMTVSKNGEQDFNNIKVYGEGESRGLI